MKTANVLDRPLLDAEVEVSAFIKTGQVGAEAPLRERYETYAADLGAGVPVTAVCDCSTVLPVAVHQVHAYELEVRVDYQGNAVISLRGAYMFKGVSYPLPASLSYTTDPVPGGTHHCPLTNVPAWVRQAVATFGVVA